MGVYHLFKAMKATDGTTIKTAITTREDKCSRLKMKILNNIEKIGDAATIGIIVVTLPVKSAVFRAMIAQLNIKPDTINQ